MQLTEEQRDELSFVGKCDPSFLIRSVKDNTNFDAKVLERVFDLAKERAAELLAAHNVGVQDPVAWLTPGNDLYLENPGYDDWTPLYSHPQPTTDAADSSALKFTQRMANLSFTSRDPLFCWKKLTSLIGEAKAVLSGIERDGSQ